VSRIRVRPFFEIPDGSLVSMTDACGE
jgi:hypothetical protein